MKEVSIVWTAALFDASSYVKALEKLMTGSQIPTLRCKNFSSSRQIAQSSIILELGEKNRAVTCMSVGLLPEIAGIRNI